MRRNLPAITEAATINYVSNNVKYLLYLRSKNILPFARKKGEVEATFHLH